MVNQSQHNENADAGDKSQQNRVDSFEDDIKLGRVDALIERMKMGLANQMQRMKISNYLDKVADPKDEYPHPLSVENMETAHRGRFKAKVAKMIDWNHPEIQTIDEASDAVKEVVKITDQILVAINNAQARIDTARTAKVADSLPLPFVFSITGLLNNALLRKNLEKIEKLHAKLTDPGSKLSKYMKVNQASHIKGHGYQLGTSALGVAGFAFAAPTMGLSMLPALATYVQGLRHNIKDLKKDEPTEAALDQLEEDIVAFRNGVITAPSKFDEIKSAYVNDTCNRIEAQAAA